MQIGRNGFHLDSRLANVYYLELAALTHRHFVLVICITLRTLRWPHTWNGVARTSRASACEQDDAADSYDNATDTGWAGLKNRRRRHHGYGGRRRHG